MRTGFDRALHFDRLDSPLADDPGGFTAPLRESAAGQALAAPRGRTRVPAPRDRGRPTRVLVLTRTNANFLPELLDHLDRHPGFEHRFVDVGPDAELRRQAGIRPLAEQVLAGAGGQPGGAAGDGLAATMQRLLGEPLRWADVVWVEWCTALAGWVGLLDPGDTRVIVRLHSYEAFSAWPHLLDATRIDDMVFVSEHVRDLVEAAVPRLAAAGGPRRQVLTLGMRLGRFDRPKPDAARFTVALVGWSSVAKDPRWAVHVVRQLRRHDERYRLLLIGAELDDSVSEPARTYGEGLRRELADLDAAGALRRTGHTGDVPAALTGAGVVLSSSVRESFHAGLVEGAASGAVPVVRDWPFFAGREHGARTLFPADWVVSTPEQAVRQILAATASDAVWRDAGSAASAYALAHWDWAVVSPGYERLLSG